MEKMMAFDEQGWFWLVDPWLAAAVLVLAVGTVVWSHAWIVAGSPPRPRMMAVRMPRSQRLAAVLGRGELRARPSLSLMDGRRGSACRPVPARERRRAA